VAHILEEYESFSFWIVSLKIRLLRFNLSLRTSRLRLPNPIEVTMSSSGKTCNLTQNAECLCIVLPWESVQILFISKTDTLFRRMSRNSTALSSSTASTSNAAPSASGLEVLGIPGRDYLREALTSCSDPLQAIEEFQVENGILLPSLRPMMPLLDLHGVKRHDFHISVMEVRHNLEGLKHTRQLQFLPKPLFWAQNNISLF